ncbi:hypothetical protein OJ997_33505 [Solirubrobacter phytolaccae]|uniref:Uncharacterized protein n=1 Tax=Solirubrobacter phytolaccae TaxID=1404360 RepID=A0A9X3SET2_9ACTN|nr:hypothetical protein [Solirubrobacter phytolaccae]MDA0185270.1 hypothetical protein [Solirubrobacter phytolaccae]
MESVVAIYSAPIPVGHRVEVHWYVAQTGGVLGPKTEQQDHQPLIKDLDTGIEYMGDWLLTHTGIKRPKRAIEVSEHLRHELEPVRVLVGTVRRCRVVTLAWSEYDVQTHLDVEPDA